MSFYFCVVVSWCQCLADMELIDFSDLQKLSLISDMSFTFLKLLYESKKFEKKRLQRIPFLVKSNYNFAPKFPLHTSMGHWFSNQNVVPTKFQQEADCSSTRFASTVRWGSILCLDAMFPGWFVYFKHSLKEKLSSQIQQLWYICTKIYPGTWQLLLNRFDVDHKFRI